MIKKIVIVILCIALGNSLYARDISSGDKFIGIEVGAIDVQGDITRGEESGIEFGLRLGAQTEQWRSMILLNYFDEGEQNTEKLMLTVDYFLLTVASEQPYFKPYLGVNVGYMSYEVSGTSDADGFLYGAQVGFVVDVMETIDVDLGYRYSLSGVDEFDHSGSVVFGINYLY